jgi:transposase
MTSDDRITQFEAENQRLREQNLALQARMQDLEAQLAKESYNSSKPSSSDGLRRKTKSLRVKSGKKPGGQLGHRGETLHLVGRPDEVVEHRPTCCPQCQAPLTEAAVVLRERRQVHELPPVVRLMGREHQVLQVRCPHCAHLSMGTFPAALPSRAQYGPRVRALAVYQLEHQHLPVGRVQHLLVDRLGQRLSRGTLVGWVRQAAQALAPVEQHIKAALVRSPVLQHDETGVRRAGTLAWAHVVTSTSRLSHYALHTKRGHEALDAIGILPTYHGVSDHDGWDSSGVHTLCRHAPCDVHHLRELTFLEVEFSQAWASDLKALLREMKAATDQARTGGQLHLAPAVHADVLERYQALLKAGLAANPPPPDEQRRAGQRGRLKQSPARNLLERLLLQQDAVLAFLDDLALPFDNHQAERDLRDLKVQQKVSGGFRSAWGAEAYATIRGYLATLCKQGHALLAALHTVFAGQPRSPASAWPGRTPVQTR